MQMDRQLLPEYMSGQSQSTELPADWSIKTERAAFEASSLNNYIIPRTFTGCG